MAEGTIRGFVRGMRGKPGDRVYTVQPTRRGGHDKAAILADPTIEIQIGDYVTLEMPAPGGRGPVSRKEQSTAWRIVDVE